MSHKKDAEIIKVNIPLEMSFVDFVLDVLITWGMKAIVVRVAATSPNTVTKSIIIYTSSGGLARYTVNIDFITTLGSTS